MSASELKKAARMHSLASFLRERAAQTGWTGYRRMMLEAARELDLEAAKVDGYRFFALPH
jgi:hypothetical protein